MKEAMKDIYVGYPALKETIARDQYKLRLDDDIFVASDDWESILSPGMSFTLQVDAEDVRAAEDAEPQSSVSKVRKQIDENDAEDSRIQLTDPRGIVYELPFGECKTLEVSRVNVLPTTL